MIPIEQDVVHRKSNLLLPAGSLGVAGCQSPTRELGSSSRKPPQAIPRRIGLSHHLAPWFAVERVCLSMALHDPAFIVHYHESCLREGVSPEPSRRELPRSSREPVSYAKRPTLLFLLTPARTQEGPSRDARDSSDKKNRQAALIRVAN